MGNGPHVLRFLYYNPSPPWTCCFCGGGIHHRGRRSDSLVVHHRDGDSSNQAHGNLASAHLGCHTRSHLAGTVPQVNKRQVSCPNGCGLVTNPGLIGRHARSLNCPKKEIT